MHNRPSVSDTSLLHSRYATNSMNDSSLSLNDIKQSQNQGDGFLHQLVSATPIISTSQNHNRRSFMSTTTQQSLLLNYDLAGVSDIQIPPSQFASVSNFSASSQLSLVDNHQTKKYHDYDNHVSASLTTQNVEQVVGEEEDDGCNGTSLNDEIRNFSLKKLKKTKTDEMPVKTDSQVLNESFNLHESPLKGPPRKINTQPSNHSLRSPPPPIPPKPQLNNLNQKQNLSGPNAMKPPRNYFKILNQILTSVE